MRQPHVGARALRRNATPAEVRFWRLVKNRQLGFRFRRQHTLGPYVADFACLEALLVVELDGDQHGRGDRPARDAERDRFLAEQGFEVLRIPNSDVYKRIYDVLDTVRVRLEERIRDPEVDAFKRRKRSEP